MPEVRRTNVSPWCMPSAKSTAPRADGRCSATAAASTPSRCPRPIRKAADDARIAAILIRIDSPGGDYVASDTIWREIIKAKEKHKPVIVSMGDMAASGGYFIAMGADHIFADPATITGSIGVFLGKIVVGDALAKLDIGHDRVVFGDSAGTFSATSDFSPRDLARLNQMLDATYADFTGKAAQGRGKSQAEIEQVARGRVWSGSDAVKVGLVDEMGGFTKAVDYIKTKIGLKADDAVTLVPFPEPAQPWQELLKSLEDGDMPLTASAFVKTAQWFNTMLGPFMAAVSAATQAARSFICRRSPSSRRRRLFRHDHEFNIARRPGDRGSASHRARATFGP